MPKGTSWAHAARPMTAEEEAHRNERAERHRRNGYRWRSPMLCSALNCDGIATHKVTYTCYSNRARTRSSDRELSYCLTHAKRFAEKNGIEIREVQF